MDWVEKGCVMKGVAKSEPLSEAVSRKYFRDLIAGLEYCKCDSFFVDGRSNSLLTWG